MASLVGRVEDLVVEHREVEGQTKADWVRWSELSTSDLGCSLVCLKGLVRGLLALIGRSKLGEVAVVVALPVEELGLAKRHNRLTDATCDLHLVVEDLGFAALSGWDQVLVQDVQDVLADLAELRLNLDAVLLDE